MLFFSTCKDFRAQLSSASWTAKVFSSKSFFLLCSPLNKKISEAAKQETMADRFFPNVMPDFVTEAAAEPDAAPTEDSHGDSLMKLLTMPYPSLSQRFQRAGLDLKENVFSVYPFVISIYLVRLFSKFGVAVCVFR